MKNEVRLIGGQWKRSKLPVADRPGLRLPFTVMILVGIAAAAYVVGVDLGLV